MTDAPKLKDHFTADVVDDLGDRARAAHPRFDAARFRAAVFAGDWSSRSFTARSRRIADALWDALELDVPRALDAIEAMLPEPLDDPEGVLSERFWLWPVGDLIAARAADHPERALDACEALTQCFTAEFAVRPLLERHPALALTRVRRWAEHPSQHVRRLASEGTRPRLPWARRLELPLEPVLDVLTVLRRDPARYVQRSVANHLNDLAKDHGAPIVDRLVAWHGEDVPETTWIVRHALRNHLKRGEPEVLALFDYAPAAVDVRAVAVEPRRVRIGETATLSFELVERAGRAQKLLVDVVVDFVKADGTTSPKVFRARDFVLAKDAVEPCRKALPMVPRSTRRLYPGGHRIRIRLNGVDKVAVALDVQPA